MSGTVVDLHGATTSGWRTGPRPSSPWASPGPSRGDGKYSLHVNQGNLEAAESLIQSDRGASDDCLGVVSTCLQDRGSEALNCEDVGEPTQSLVEGEGEGPSHTVQGHMSRPRGVRGSGQSEGRRMRWVKLGPLSTAGAWAAWAPPGFPGSHLGQVGGVHFGLKWQDGTCISPLAPLGYHLNLPTSNFPRHIDITGPPGDSCLHPRHTPLEDCLAILPVIRPGNLGTGTQYHLNFKKYGIQTWFAALIYRYGSSSQ